MSINKTFGERVRERRKQIGISQDELGRRIGYKSRSSINKIELGERDISQTKAVQIAKALDTSVDYLLGDEPLTKSESFAVQIPGIIPVPDLSTVKSVPLLGSIACGEPITANEEYESIEIDEMLDADFCLRARGDSMIDAGIRNGSLVLCRYAETVENGQIAAIGIQDEVTLKRFYSYGETVVLRPCNPDYEEQVYSGEELNRIRIIGKAVTCISPIN